MGEPLAVLQMLLPGNRIDKFPFTRPMITIGRSNDNDVIFEDDNISRRHMLLEIVNGVPFITDLGSANGVHINHQVIPVKLPTYLAYGDEIELDEYRLQVNRCTSGDPPAYANRVRVYAENMPGLVVTYENTLLKFPFDKLDLTLGRASECDITIPHTQINLRHAYITYHRNICTITDLESDNGLSFQGVRIHEYVFGDGDAITVNDQVKLQFFGNIGFIPEELLDGKPRKPYTGLLNNRPSSAT
jgi:pSer/pThr/pTyr-binding forkhead associated (FHA) protein